MTYEQLLLERGDDGVATMTLNRPEKLNAYSRQLEEEMRAATREIAEDDGVKALVVTGAGRAFSAGGDVGDMKPGGGWHLPRAEREVRFNRLHEVAIQLHRMPKPAIAMVNGFAVGAGCNLALACDLRIASDQSRYGLAFINVGLGDDMGGAWFLPRLVGSGKAMELFLTGAIIDSAEALRIGMVNRVVEHDQLAEETYALARKLAGGATHAQALLKETLQRSLTMSLEDLLEFEARRQADEMEHPDHVEGAAAFLEKREAQFGRSST